MIKVSNIVKIFNDKKRTVKALDNVSFELPSTGLVLFSGASGSGKTTLMKILSLNSKPTSGKIEIDGVDISKLSRKENDSLRCYGFGFIDQKFNLLNDLSVEENLNIQKELVNKTVDYKEYLKRVNLEEDVLKAYPDTLSGGQQQRVSIIRTLMKNPNVIFADESTGALDDDNALGIVKILKDISKERLVIVVSHNVELFKPFADDKYIISDGHIKSQDVSSKEYGKNMIVLDKKKTGLPWDYTTKLGFAYAKRQPFKIISSVFTLIISFALIFLLINILSYDSNKLFDRTKENNYQLTSVSKFKPNDFISLEERIFTNDELAQIKKKVGFILPIYLDSNVVSKGGKSFSLTGVANYTEENLKSLGVTLIGELPKKRKEIVISKAAAAYVGIDIENFEKIEVNFNREPYTLTGIINTKSSVDTTNLYDIIQYQNYGMSLDCFVCFDSETSKFYEEERLICRVVFNSNFKELKNIMEMKLDNGNEYGCYDLAYESIYWCDSFYDTAKKVALYCSLVFGIFALIILVNMVYNSISDRKYEIGILNSLGTNLSSIMKIFFFQPLIIIAISMICSFVVSLFAQSKINDYCIETYGVISKVIIASPLSLIVIPIAILFAMITTIIPLALYKKKQLA